MEKIFLYDLTGDKIRKLTGEFFAEHTPRIGDSIKINGKQYRVVDVHWIFEPALMDWTAVDVYVRDVFEKAKEAGS